MNNRCGDTDRADLHMTKASPACKEDLSAKIAQVKDHLIRGGEARKNDDWIAALKEVEAMIAAGADSSQPVINSMEITTGDFLNSIHSSLILILLLKFSKSF